MLALAVDQNLKAAIKVVAGKGSLLTYAGSAAEVANISSKCIICRGHQRQIRYSRASGFRFSSCRIPFVFTSTLSINPAYLTVDRGSSFIG